ncbi:MAG: acetyl-CoA carboxylase, carboxyltransferase subunit beta [Alphaproteobacteria bacterium]|nr:acetyl-CoA carboxylase, carboxyltransferase subunit beta [Alphaproteobacteria bacterium]
MSWLTNFVRPKIRALVGEKKEVPDNLWEKCPGCNAMLFKKDLEANMNVCRSCGFHLKLDPETRLKSLFDDEVFALIDTPRAVTDPLKFRDQKKYADRLKAAQTKTKKADAVIVGSGEIMGVRAVVAVFNFAFMGGSMGAAVGEAIVAAAKHAVATRSAFIVFPASGGARMQEGMLSLMQMPRTVIAADLVKEAGLPFIVVMTDPTTGGVTASFAMVGDIHIAEKGALIGFAGARVIENTIRETLPEGFQRAEYLKDHGMVDIVVERKNLRETLGRILRLLRGRKHIKKGSVSGPVPHGARLRKA